ncbi:CHAT domain-containing protein [Sandarakinorhabdus sp.]|uniref:CHAT domain-containing protein n=1 Tax=Sandarakinorhabdus sp. TaxID=1916663 RepID=UPI00286DAA3E|nr:CHAT domain-containing protein [Sandarakinorhabdus sp.]
MKRYINLLVTISARGDGSFDARASSEGRAGNINFRPPFRLADIAGGLLGPGSHRGVGTAQPRDAGPAKTATEYGVELFDALFQGKTRDVFMATSEEARRQNVLGVRIRMTFDLSNPAIAEVAALPWELMRPSDGLPLVVSTEVALVRSLDVAGSNAKRPLVKPLRILLIQSNPTGTGVLNLGAERAMLQKSWTDMKEFMVDEVEPVAAKIRDKLSGSDYHVVHYMGHGDFEAERGGMLLLEREDGGPHKVSAATFANWLRAEPLRLVFLNACETGTTPAVAGPHPFAGVATALIQGGVPAVIAMQFPISDAAAIEFSRTFYLQIARGAPVDAAVAEGRNALFDDDSTEWATPVLYLRAEDGDLFDDDDAPVAVSAPAKPVIKAPEQAPLPLMQPQPTPPQPVFVPPAEVPIWKQPKIYLAMLAGAVLLIVLIGILVPDAEEDGVITDPAADAAAPAADAMAPASDAAAPEEAVQTIATVKGPGADQINIISTAEWSNDEEDPSLSRRVWDAMSGTDEEKLATLQSLADQEYPEAQYVLAMAYADWASALAPSPDAAAVLMRKAADATLAVAEYRIGFWYLEGSNNLRVDKEQARSWLTRAVAQGSNWAKQTLDDPQNWQ